MIGLSATPRLEIEITAVQFRFHPKDYIAQIRMASRQQVGITVVVDYYSQQKPYAESSSTLRRGKADRGNRPKLLTFRVGGKKSLFRAIATVMLA